MTQTRRHGCALQGSPRWQFTWRGLRPHKPHHFHRGAAVGAMIPGASRGAPAHPWRGNVK